MANFENLLPEIESRVKRSDFSDETKKYINQATATRIQLREGKQYKQADDIRKRLESTGIVIEDAVGGTAWKVKR
jgi:cysteinyl-tRNA synthetase